jgi:hypothetical protein
MKECQVKSCRSLVIAGCLLIGACGNEAPQSADAPAPNEAAPAASSTTALPLVTVHKTPTCGCCSKWVDHMKASGFQMNVIDLDNLNDIKTRVGIPPAMGSCHTAEVGGYFVEGHVPANDVLRLLKEKPDAKGITVPRMPIGSPGMEVGDEKEPYDVILVKKDGTTEVYAKHGE